LLSGGFTITPQQYGAVADGTSHPLSEFYGTLGEAQDAYNHAFYFVTSLSQEIDYVATKAASNACFGPDLSIGPYISSVSAAGTTTLIIDPTANYVVNELVGSTLFMRYYNGFVESSSITANTATTISLATAIDPYLACAGHTCLSACALPPQVYDCMAYAIGHGEHGFTGARLNRCCIISGWRSKP
jgi:hypothetical protein